MGGTPSRPAAQHRHACAARRHEPPQLYPAFPAGDTTVVQWLLNQRLALAQRMLETANQTIEGIAQEAGFGSALSLRQHFRAAYNTSPSAYRKQFLHHAD